MSQQTLAEKVGVTRQTIFAIEKDKYSPSLEVAFKISNVFFKNNDFKLIQYTLRLEGKKDEKLKLHDKRKIRFYKKNGYRRIENIYMFEKNL